MGHPDSGQFSPETATCRACHRMVRFVDVGGGARVATDPELIAVVYAGGHEVERARRVHAERCADYQAEAKRTRLTAERRRYERTHRKGRETGL